MTRLNFMVQKINTWPAVARQNLIWSICHFTSSEILMILFTYSVFLFLFSDNPPVFKHKDMHAFKKKNKQIGNEIVYPHYISQTKVNAWIRAGYLATTPPPQLQFYYQFKTISNTCSLAMGSLHTVFSIHNSQLQ